MPLVFAGIIPHSPLLLATVAKEHHQMVSEIVATVKSISADLHARQVELIIILTPHGPIIRDTAVVEVDEKYQGRLAEFGDISTAVKARGAPAAAHRLKELAERAELKISLQTVGSLDYGLTVPIALLTTPHSSWKVLPVSVVGLDVSGLLRLAEVINDLGHQQPERIALIASGDLDRRSDNNKKASSSSGASWRPTKAEKIIAQAVTKLEVAPLMNSLMPPSICGFKPILTWLACIQTYNSVRPEYNFAAPFGVGLMTVSLPI